MMEPAAPSPDASSPSRGSIRDGSPTPHAGSPVPQEEDTFTSMLSISVNAPIGSMSISPANRDVALGARKGLYVVDLQNPWDIPRFLPHDSAWEVADVQWNPFPARSEWVVSTSNQQAVVYNLSLSPSLTHSPIEHALYGHTRAVTDINWSPTAPELLATCALDGWVLAWDLRTGYGSRGASGRGRKPVWRTCGWSSPATQVKWNRKEPHLIASSHNNDVLIWDDRMGAAPVKTIRGHSARIYGIDWSRKKSDELVTCSLDKTFKFWSLNDTTTPSLSMSTTSPVWRARWLPFGNGVLTLPQRSDHALSIWGEEHFRQDGAAAEPVARFEGAREGVKEFVWRARGGDDLENDDRQFQLVTWAKDRRLRLWPISEELTKEVGHVKGDPIRIPLNWRGGPDVSYRTFAESPAPPLPLSFPPASAPVPKHLTPGTSLLSASLSSPSTPSLLTSSLLNANYSSSLSSEKENLAPTPTPFAPPALDARPPTATMSVGKVRSKRRRAQDRLAWMEGVKIIKPVPALEDEQASDDLERKGRTEDRHSEPTTRASSMVRGTDAGTVTAREGTDTERAESLVTGESLATGTATAKEATYTNLGEEITSVVRRFPRVNFEKVHVAGRSCTISLYSPLFLRATFSFPKRYPAVPPSIELERSADFSLKQRATLLQGVRKLMTNRSERGLSSLEAALRYLLGDRSFDRIEEDDDDEAEEALEGSVLNNLPSNLLRNNVNVPPPRRGGATFGPSGQLVVFFPTNVFETSSVDKETSSSPPNEPETRGNKFPLRLSEAFGNLPSESPEYEGDYQETDEALQMTTSRSYRAHSLARRKSLILAQPSPAPPTFSTTVKIKDVSHLTLVHPSQMIVSLGQAPIVVAREAFENAIVARDLLLAKVWSTVVAFFETGLGADGDFVSNKLESLLAERLLQELLVYLAHLKDLQTLGVIACLLEGYTRDFEESVRLRSLAAKPEVDYFSHKHRRFETASTSTSTGGDRTPLPTSSTYQRRSDPSQSPRPSWANLSGFFNTSMLSLRSGASSSPSSPDRTPLTRPSSSHGFPTAHSPLPSPGLGKSPLRTSNNFPTITRTDTTTTASDDGNTRRAPRIRSKTSPGVTFGATSVAVLSPKISPILASVPEQYPPSSQRSDQSKGLRANRRQVSINFTTPSALHEPVCWWLTDRAMLELELVRLAYAELLHRWGFDEERVQVLKLCRGARVSIAKYAYSSKRIAVLNGLDEKNGLDLSPCCGDCGAVLLRGHTACIRCKKRQKPAACIICHLFIQGLTSNCSNCGHVGHLDCLEKWYESEADCPTGCGCRCVSSGGLSGFTLSARSVNANQVYQSTNTKVVTPSWVSQGFKTW
ncbi:Mtc5p [Sporobolomyces salmoneus]|uniref:Mtc5p n=1 Tax=Sporobolomyces salmoneus TaxID=183962 RepID=UPI00317299E7